MVSLPLSTDASQMPNFLASAMARRWFPAQPVSTDTNQGQPQTPQLGMPQAAANHSEDKFSKLLFKKESTFEQTSPSATTARQAVASHGTVLEDSTGESESTEPMSSKSTDGVFSQGWQTIKTWVTEMFAKVTPLAKVNKQDLAPELDSDPKESSAA